MNRQAYEVYKAGRREPKKYAVLRLFFYLFIASVAYWGGVFVLYWLALGFSGILYNALGSSLYLALVNSRELFLIVGYLAVLLAVIGRYVYKLARDINEINRAAASLLTLEPNLPSDIRAVEDTLRELRFSILRNQAAAREAEQKKNDLVVYLAHDLKTPLTSVIGYLTLLDESPDLPLEQRAKYTSITLEKAYRLEQLINEFFDITRFGLQSAVLENNRIDFSMMLEQMADEFYPVLRDKGLRIELSVEPNLQLIGDSDKLARIFDNLLRNAISYSYPDSPITLYAWEQDGYVKTVVRNLCDQIPKEKQNMIFEKFFRLDSSRGSSTGGAGLGLAIAKEIAELHGGSICLNSTPEYTDFIVTLPKVKK